MNFVGSIEWDKDGVRKKIEIDPSHPFLPVFDAISLIKGDLDELLNSRRAAQEKQRESEEKYRKILKEINDAFFEVDIKGNITFCKQFWIPCPMAFFSSATTKESVTPIRPPFL